MINLKKLLLLITGIFCFCQIAAGQKTEDVLYLKNKWVLRGIITSNNDKQVVIETRDHNVFVFDNAEVDHLAKEAVSADVNTKTHGFASFTELGPLAARNTSEMNVNTSAFSFQSVNGFKFNQWLFTGLGVGADLYATQTFFPLFGSIRGDLVAKKQFVPYYFVDAGYGFNGTVNNGGSAAVKGGALYAMGLGLKIGLSRSAGVLISVGFRTQSYQTIIDGSADRSTYKRLALRAGFYL